MNPEELKKLKEQFPNTTFAQFIVLPCLQKRLAAIERSWHTDEIANMEKKAIEKILLLSLARDMKLEVPDTLQSDDRNHTASIPDAGT